MSFLWDDLSPLLPASIMYCHGRCIYIYIDMCICIDIHTYIGSVLTLNAFLLFMFLQNIDDIRHCRKTKIPCFDFEKCSRIGFKELEVSEDCGVV